MNTPTYVLGLVVKLCKPKVEILQWHGGGSAGKKNGNSHSFILVHTMECWRNEIIMLQLRKQLMQFFGKLTKSWRQVYIMPCKMCHMGGQQAQGLEVIILFRLQHPQSALPLSFLSHTFTVHVTLLIYIYKGRKGLGCAQLIDIHSQTHIRSSDAPQKY